MALNLDKLPIYQTASRLADEVWEATQPWDRFAREVVGSQFVRAVDSIGANIAESQ